VEDVVGTGMLRLLMNAGLVRRITGCDFAEIWNDERLNGWWSKVAEGVTDKVDILVELWTFLWRVQRIFGSGEYV